MTCVRVGVIDFTPAKVYTHVHYFHATITILLTFHYMYVSPDDNLRSSVNGQVGVNLTKMHMYVIIMQKFMCVI